MDNFVDEFILTLFVIVLTLGVVEILFLAGVLKPIEVDEKTATALYTAVYVVALGLMAVFSRKIYIYVVAAAAIVAWMWALSNAPSLTWYVAGFSALAIYIIALTSPRYE